MIIIGYSTNVYSFIYLFSLLILFLFIYLFIYLFIKLCVSFLFSISIYWPAREITELGRIYAKALFSVLANQLVRLDSLVIVLSPKNSSVVCQWDSEGYDNDALLWLSVDWRI